LININIDSCQYFAEDIDGCQYRNMETSALLQTCCPRLLSGGIQPSEAVQLAALFRVLGEPARLQILSLIAAQPNLEVCVCELMEPLGLSQPTISHHLKVLYEAGLLDRERRGNWIYYRLVPERIELLRQSLA
jgi:ArsR family transcriptional regulator